MTARTHDVIAFSSLVTVAALNPPALLNVPTACAAMVGNIVGSLLPDLDQASNRLWDLLPFGDQVGKVLRNLFLSHRTITHSLAGVVGCSYVMARFLPAVFQPNYIYWRVVFDAIMIGYISHLVADSMTKEGLPLFFPLKINVGFPPVEWLRVKTGGWVENGVILPGVIAYLFWFVGRNQEKLVGIARLLGN